MPIFNPTKSPVIVSSSAIPVGIPSSGSIGNNGALTGLTAFPVTYSAGIYLYFPAGAIAAGSAAGKYWTVMSSTTAGTIFNNTYTSGELTAPASNTAFVTTGPGAYVQDVTEITLRSSTGVTPLMGPTGQLRMSFLLNFPTSANAKTIKAKINTTAFLSTAPTANLIFRGYCWVMNTSLTTQIFPGAASAAAYMENFSGTALGSGTENTATDLPIVTTGQLALATEYLVSLSSNIQVIPT